MIELGSDEKRRAGDNSIRVLKFGGTSVKSIGRIQHVCEILCALAKNAKVLAVISAMGDTTDYLIKLAGQCAQTPDKRELDSLLSTGEQISISLVALTLKSMSQRARSLNAAQIGIFTESVHSKARIVDINSERLLMDFSNNDILVAAGFQGVTESGDITTLGRGGSDTTAVALAAALSCEYCDIYTDVDGVFTADPNKIPKARLLPRVSYFEVLEMARLGAQVLHPRAVDLARQYAVKLRVRNTFKPEHEGTIIDGGEGVEIYRSVSGVVVDEDQASVAIMDVPDQPGIAGKVTSALAEKSIAIDMIVQSFHPSIGLNSIAFTVHESDLKETIEVLEAIKTKIGAKSVAADAKCAKVSIIGAALAGQPKVAATLFSVLGEAKVNIKMISSSEMKISCIVDRAEAVKAAQLLHDAFELDK